MEEDTGKRERERELLGHQYFSFLSCLVLSWSLSLFPVSLVLSCLVFVFEFVFVLSCLVLVCLVSGLTFLFSVTKRDYQIVQKLDKMLRLQRV